MKVAYYLGIDGGGSFCRARLRDAQGALLGEATGDMANIHQDFDRAINSILATALAAGGEVPLHHIHAGLGLAGATGPAQCARVQAVGLPFASAKVDSDGYIACLGAHGGGDGGIVIAGTGSAGFALVAGQRMSIGGHGFMLGDQGSGAVIGRAALQNALLAHDNIVPGTALTRQIMAQFHDDPGEAIAWSRTALSRDYASFAPMALAAAQAGDHDALAIVAQAADGLANMGRQLRRAGAPRLCLIGGLGAAISRWLPADMFAPPLADPLEGAILLARQ